MRKRAQSTIEFTFTLIVIVLLAYGMIQVFRWSGMDLAERRWAHDQVFENATYRDLLGISGADATYLQQFGLGISTPLDETEQQLIPDFYRPKRMHAVSQQWQ